MHIAIKTILVVEDERSIAQMLVSILQDEGYAVITAANGAEALQLLRDEHPDMILSDMMMPVMSGTELCKQLQADLLHSLIPLVLMSSAYSPIDIDACGAAGFLKKPFLIEQLLEMICRVTPRARQFIAPENSRTSVPRHRYPPPGCG